jgi:uncharacterized protein
MVITTMDEERCRKMMARVGFGRLACSKNDQPYIVPIYFACEGSSAYGFSLIGKKIEWMRANPLVCLEVDEVNTQFDWRSVVATGRYEELPDVPEFAAERKVAQRLLQQRYMAWQTPYEVMHHHQVSESAAPPVFYCIRIDEISGLAAKPEPFESASPF